VTNPYATARMLADTLSAPEPRVVAIKIVPKSKPNADGRWIRVVAEARHLNPRKWDSDRERRRLTMWEALEELAPADHFVCALTDQA
jgi:hypothetical protein